MVRRGHPCARGARRARHGPPARTARPCTALSPPTISRATPCIRVAPPGDPPAEDARPPTRTIVAGMVGMSRNTPAYPTRPRPHRRRGDTDRTLGRASRRAWPPHNRGARPQIHQGHLFSPPPPPHGIGLSPLRSDSPPGSPARGEGGAMRRGRMAPLSRSRESRVGMRAAPSEG